MGDLRSLPKLPPRRRAAAACGPQVGGKNRQQPPAQHSACFALLCFASLCFALLCFALLCCLFFACGRAKGGGRAGRSPLPREGRGARITAQYMYNRGEARQPAAAAALKAAQARERAQQAMAAGERGSAVGGRGLKKREGVRDQVIGSGHRDQGSTATRQQMGAAPRADGRQGRASGDGRTAGMRRSAFIPEEGGRAEGQAGRRAGGRECGRRQGAPRCCSGHARREATAGGARQAASTAAAGLWPWRASCRPPPLRPRLRRCAQRAARPQLSKRRPRMFAGRVEGGGAQPHTSRRSRRGSPSGPITRASAVPSNGSGLGAGSNAERAGGRAGTRSTTSPGCSPPISSWGRGWGGHDEVGHGGASGVA
jgi:hypothetical protein